LQKLKKGIAELVEEARKNIEEVTPEEAIELSKRDDVVIVDVRDVRERGRGGYVPDSFHCPRGMVEFWVDPESPYFKEVFDDDTGGSKRWLFHCAVDWRSALTVNTLHDMGFKGAAHIKGGFNAWKDAGGPVEYKEGDKSRPD